MRENHEAVSFLICGENKWVIRDEKTWKVVVWDIETFDIINKCKSLPIKREKGFVNYCNKVVW